MTGDGMNSNNASERLATYLGLALHALAGHRKPLPDSPGAPCDCSRHGAIVGRALEQEGLVPMWSVGEDQVNPSRFEEEVKS